MNGALRTGRASVAFTRSRKALGRISDVSLTDAASANLARAGADGASPMALRARPHRIAAARRSRSSARRRPPDASPDASLSPNTPGARGGPPVTAAEDRRGRSGRRTLGRRPCHLAPPRKQPAEGLDTGCAHGHGQIPPDSPGTLFSQEGPELMS